MTIILANCLIYISVYLDTFCCFQNHCYHLFNSLPIDKCLDWLKLKTFAKEKLIMVNIVEFVPQGEENSGKRRKCWLPAFSPFLTMFSKAFKSQ